jgi:acetylglutamate kinase
VTELYAQNVVATLSYVKRFAGTTLLIKLGGAVLQDADRMAVICEDLKVIRSVGIKVVLVHGGGPLINAELESRGIKWEFVDGLRVTTPEMMDVIEQVLCGAVNRKIVRALNYAGVAAVGISGTDASTLMCKAAGKKLGQVGVIESVDSSVIEAILSAKGAIPVIAPIGTGPEGEGLNINADWAASRIAQSMGLKKVIFLTDQDGILDAQGKLVQEADAAELEQLIETSVVKGGMLAKVRTVLDALKNGVNDLHIINGRRPHALIEELFTDRGVGTVCRLRSRGEA